MRKQALIPLAVGLIVGIAALKLGYDRMDTQSQTKAPDIGPVEKVVVATQDIPAGVTLEEKHLTVVEMPAKLVPADAVTDAEKLIGQTLRTATAAKMPVLTSMVGPGQGLESMIPEGYRAVSVKVDEFTGVAGLLKPGDRVDVAATFKFRGPEGSETLSKIVLQNVEVRAVGRKFQDDKADALEKMSRSVTLLVKPDQVERLQLAASCGTIRLALRGQLDNRPAFTTGTTLAKVLANQGDANGNKASSDMFSRFFALAHKKQAEPVRVKVEPKPVEKTPAPKVEPYVVEVLVGDKVERILFESPHSDRRVNPLGLKTPAKPEQQKSEKQAVSCQPGEPEQAVDATDGAIDQTPKGKFPVTGPSDLFNMLFSGSAEEPSASAGPVETDETQQVVMYDE